MTDIASLSDDLGRGSWNLVKNIAFYQCDTPEENIRICRHFVASLQLPDILQRLQRPLLTGVGPGPGRHFDGGFCLPTAQAWNRVGGAEERGQAVEPGQDGLLAGDPASGTSSKDRKAALHIDLALARIESDVHPLADVG